ncbi:MAG: RNA-binding S4 domain-containing protein, partial [Candidatus Binatia bacterium]
WLWAARFFKTRSAAADAVTGGKVHLNGARTKPAHVVRPGDALSVHRGIYETDLIVRAVSERRSGAPEAALLYEETEESRARREALRVEARAVAGVRAAGRPTKHDRRELRRLRRS